MQFIDESTIDKILSFDKYGSIDLIVALRLNNLYIRKYSNIINNSDKDELPMSEFLFLCSWRLQSLVRCGLYNKIDQNTLDILPKEIWDKLSLNSYLRESFIIKNAHNLNLAKVKYFRKGEFSHRFHAALPTFKNLDKCTECFEHDTITDFSKAKDNTPYGRIALCEKKRICSVCLQNLCRR